MIYILLVSWTSSVFWRQAVKYFHLPFTYKCLNDVCRRKNRHQSHITRTSPTAPPNAAVVLKLVSVRESSLTIIPTKYKFPHRLLFHLRFDHKTPGNYIAHWKVLIDIIPRAHFCCTPGYCPDPLSYSTPFIPHNTVCHSFPQVPYYTEALRNPLIHTKLQMP